MDSLKDHIRRQIDDFLLLLQQQFTIDLVEVGGIDFSVWKIYLRACLYPKRQSSFTYEDANITLRNTMKPLVNEIKKVGVLIDRGMEI